MSEEAAVNAMAAQVVYGDDELKEDMKKFIRDTVYEDSGTIGRMAIVNNAREIEKIVARYLGNKLINDQY